MSARDRWALLDIYEFAAHDVCLRAVMMMTMKNQVKKNLNQNGLLVKSLTSEYVRTTNRNYMQSEKLSSE